MQSTQSPIIHSYSPFPCMNNYSLPPPLGPIISSRKLELARGDVEDFLVLRLGLVNLMVLLGVAGRVG